MGIRKHGCSKQIMIYDIHITFRSRAMSIDDRSSSCSMNAVTNLKKCSVTPSYDAVLQCDAVLHLVMMQCYSVMQCYT